MPQVFLLLTTKVYIFTRAHLTLSFAYIVTL